MIRPPSSHVPSPGNQPMFQPQDASKLSQQMQGLNLGPSSPQHPGMPSYTSHLSNQQLMPSTPSLSNQQFPSPQHKKSQISTNVTYSTQLKATYPYLNNNPAGNVGIQQNMNNNQYGPNNTFPGQVTMPSPMSNQAQKGNKSHITNPVQAYSPNPTSINSPNYSNGISNGHDDNKQPWNAGLQSYQSPHPLPNHSMPQPSSSHQGQVQYLYGAQNRNLQPQQNVSTSPLTNTGPPVQQYVSPNSQIIQSPGHGHNVLNNQSLPPVQPGYQQYPPQTPNMAYPPNMSSPPTSPVSFPSGPQQYHGMPPTQPNPQFPGMTPQSPGNYPYGAPNQSQQQPPKIDLDQMPNTVQVRQEDRNLRSGYYSTDVKGHCPPLVTTNFIVQDRGMCSPRFIRSTLYCLPNNPDILKQAAIPFAITVSPLAAIHDGESEPPACLYREQGPLRCKRCKAYVCSFMTFMEGGRCFQCAFCKVVTEVPQDYFCFLDGLGERTDKYHRPELCLGSYEFPATKEYCRKDELPNPPAYIFMIEVSNATFRNGLVPLFCENLKNILQCLQNDEKNDTSKLRVGFVTYNNVLHFYNLKKNLTQPHIMVLSDVHNAFVPLLDGFLVTLSEAEALVDCLMEHIPRLFINEPATEIILGPVIQVGLEALKNANCSGKLLVFHSTIPNADAPGKLPHREGQKLLGTEKQKIALSPQNDFYSKLAQECVAAGCAVDLFLFPSAYVDIASISPLCKHTGGQMYKYTYFQSHIDGDRFLEDLERNITTTTAFDAVLRIRTSAGISPVFYYGNFYMSNATDIELSALDCHKAITVEFAYDDKLTENETVFIQAALLYTTCTGERRIRVHNLAIATSVNMPDVFRCCELDTIINFFAKQALKQLLDHSPQQLKNNIINRAVKILACYRKNCATSSVSGQLILPDTLKLLPLYINCVLKSDAVAGGPDMSLDDRSFAMLAVNSMDVKSTAIYFYPNLIPLHEVDPDAESVPSLVRCSIEKLHDNGVYLLENGIYMFLWIGQAVSPNWLEDVFGVQSTNLVDKQKTSLPELNTPLSKKIRQIIEDLEEGRQWYMRLTVMVQGDKLEVVFRQFLVEDRGVEGSPSYVDFLCHLHREISKNL